MKNFKLICKDINGKSHEPEFDTRIEAEEMQARILEKNEWNFATKEVLIPAWQETIPATETEPEYVVVHLDEIKIVPDVVFEVVDNTVTNEAEKTKREQKKKDHADRITTIKGLNIDGMTTVAQLKAVVKLLVAEVLKDEQ